ncbi:MAG: RagB/SusD family nutrient uptake outer membrane protein [Bacteroidales bacterium]|nr:RagB/SusD family nutrient uptake outer membrane protein [Bacteroidales bacterium]
MKKILLGFAVLASMSFASCEGFLEQEPTGSQSDVLTLSEYDGLNSAAAALCALMQSDGWMDGQLTMAAEMMVGNARNPLQEAGSGRYRGLTTWNYHKSSTLGLFSYGYYTVACCNNILNNLEGKTSNVVTEQMINNIKAEALFMRAFSMHQMVCVYAQPYSYVKDLPADDPKALGIPVVTKTEFGFPARNTVQEVYAQIEADLLEAEAIMADDYVRSGALDKAATIQKTTIQAFLSRVYLHMENWQGAADYATKVINCGKYALADKAEYKSMFGATVAPEGGEIIFEVFGSNQNGYWDNSGWSHLSYVTNFGEDGSADVCATQDLIDLYEEGDVRLEMYAENKGEFYTKKYPGKEGASVPRFNNICLIRLSELYLTRAEALVNGAKIAGVSADMDMATIANKRGVEAPAATLANIFDERRRELAFEGHGFFDFHRSQKSVVRKDFHEDKNQNVAFPSYQWALPIPLHEMDVNPNMKQNEGY